MPIEFESFARKLYRKDFSIEGWKFTLVNFHLSPRSLYKKEFNNLEVQNLHQVPLHLSNHASKNTILLGDFNAYPCSDQLDEQGYENVFRPHEFANQSKTDCLDNILVHHTLRLCCMRHEVKDDIHMKGTVEGKSVTFFDHYPIWADFT